MIGEISGEKSSKFYLALLKSKVTFCGIQFFSWAQSAYFKAKIANHVFKIKNVFFYTLYRSNTTRTGLPTVVLGWESKKAVSHPSFWQILFKIRQHSCKTIWWNTLFCTDNSYLTNYNILSVVTMYKYGYQCNLFNKLFSDRTIAKFSVCPPVIGAYNLR